jgi:hypothetical protein
MTGAPRLPRRRPRPGPEKAAFDAWHRDGPAVAMRNLMAAGINPRDQADFLRTVIGLPDAHIPDYLKLPLTTQKDAPPVLTSPGKRPAAGLSAGGGHQEGTRS